MNTREQLYVIFLQFLGYFWNLSVYVVILPILLFSLGQGLDYLVFKEFFGVEQQLMWGTVPVAVINLVGMIVMAGGLLIFLEALMDLFEHADAFPFSITPHHYLSPDKLVKSGWYGRIRHPMLLGYLIMLLGVGIFVQSVTYIVWWVPVTGLLMLQYNVLVEEKRLERWFGEEYTKYRETVPALFPHFPLRMNDATNES